MLTTIIPPFRRSEKTHRPDPISLVQMQFRNDIERDHDRILFSTPFRRMGDKTQVFPLESIESIRTRLTHSYEVANLARSMGTVLAATLSNELPCAASRTVPAALAGAGLAHDIGNPPFGHQGEQSIRAWFERNQSLLFAPRCNTELEIKGDLNSLTPQHKNDFLKFEGNAQTLRVLTKLQVIGDDLGLNLTMCTLASVMKYVVASDKIDQNVQGCKKHGFLASEQQVVRSVRECVGLIDFARHPFALLMEACDDIAYSVLDAEDAVKKGLVSFNDLISWLRSRDGISAGAADRVIEYVCAFSESEHRILINQKLEPDELNNVAMLQFRTCAIQVMVAGVMKTFSDNYNLIMAGSFHSSLIDSSEVKELCRALKRFDLEHAFKHRSVLDAELNGHNIINGLMDFLWMGISQRVVFAELGSRRKTPFAEYVYSRISRNYRRVFEGKISFSYTHDPLPIRYRELQLLTDMIAGMTDQFCVDLYHDLKMHYVRTDQIGRPFT